MAADGRRAAEDPGRPVWVLPPLEGVGPLRFGMRAEEVAAAVPDAHWLGRFEAEPYWPEILGLRFGFRPAVPAVYAYFDGPGRLFCVAADAAAGPQVTLDGCELTGRPPARLQDALHERPWPEGSGVSYGPRGNPAVNAIGLVLRVQETPGGVLTRPVLVGREWADRCADDAEGPVPECEWLGRQWPCPGYPDVLPPAGESPGWPRGWRPPF
ncbi:hypothetical protein [Streptomyces sp. NRRL B-24484]|uniref:hypothetical protein n=1 Tax=Streptomyces sp. NRRL B-24484 TaxID=1463833 RepID=UPI0005B93103|nr:hypothetical protein [Streptomyces sp. NRRL B-24484]